MVTTVQHTTLGASEIIYYFFKWMHYPFNDLAQGTNS